MLAPNSQKTLTHKLQKEECQVDITLEYVQTIKRSRMMIDYAKALLILSQICSGIQLSQFLEQDQFLQKSLGR